MSKPSPLTARRDRRRDRAGVLGSLVVHALAALVFGVLLSRIFVTPKPEVTTRTETITLAKKTPPPKLAIQPQPRAAAPARLAVVPPPRAVVPPPRAVVPPPRAIAPPHPAVVPPLRVIVPQHVPRRVVSVPRQAAPPVPAPVATSPPVFARGTRPSPQRPGRNRLSGAQIASIQNDLATSIAQDRAAIDPIHVDHPAPLATPKDYGATYTAFDDVGEGKRGHGLCDPITNWVADGFDYYYVVCNVRSSDGSSHRENVPWPVRFPPDDNPFVGTAKGSVPLAMPLPGWHESSNTEISEELRSYAKDHGVSL